jgi:hypothetical protein
VQGDRWFDPTLYDPKTPADTARLLSSYDRLVEHLGGHQVGEGPGGYRYVKRASGIHWDLVYRKRKSEASYLTVCTHAARYGVAVPLNAKIVSMIEEVEAGARGLGWQNIADATAFAKQIGATLP